MSLVAEYESLLETIYDTTLAVTHWPVLLEAIRSAVGGELCMLSDRDNGVIWAAGLHKEGLDAGAARRGTPNALDLLAHRMTSEVPGEDRVGLLSVHRSARSGPFGADERALFDRLGPHVTRVLALQRQLGTARRERAGATEALDGLAAGALLADRSSRILYANRTAETLLHGGDPLGAASGQLHAARPDQTAELRAVIARIAREPDQHASYPSEVMRLDRSDGTAMTVLICALRPGQPHSGSESPTALMLICNQEGRARPASAALSQAYGLTPAQAGLLAALIKGERLGDYAERTGITKNTGRSHLRQIFEKTGCTRQADLIRQVLSQPNFDAAEPGR